MQRQPQQLELFPDLTEETVPSAQAEPPGSMAPNLPSSSTGSLEGGPSAAANAPTRAPARSPIATSPPSRPPLRRRLEQVLGEPLASLITTENRSRIVSARRSTAGLEVRIHRVFEHADETTLGAVADVLLAERRSHRRQRALDLVRRHFEHHRPTARQRRESLRPLGRHFDLRQLRDQVNGEYFAGQIEVDITWGRSPQVRRRRRGGYSLRLGSYDEQRRLVRLHPCLDRPETPRYVVESVVYHEMLHAALPPQRRGSRRYVHTAEFRRRERLFRHFDAASRWLEANLERLAALR